MGEEELCISCLSYSVPKPWRREVCWIHLGKPKAGWVFSPLPMWGLRKGLPNGMLHNNLELLWDRAKKAPESALLSCGVCGRAPHNGGQGPIQGSNIKDPKSGSREALKAWSIGRAAQARINGNCRQTSGHAQHLQGQGGANSPDTNGAKGTDHRFISCRNLYQMPARHSRSWRT